MGRGNESLSEAGFAASVRSATRCTRISSAEVAWHLTLGRYRELRKRAVPLSPRGRLVLREVHADDDLAVLPASVAGRVGAEQRVTAVGQLAPPEAVDGDPVDRHLYGWRLFERGDDLRDAAILAATGHLERLVVSSAGTGLRSQTAM